MYICMCTHLYILSISISRYIYICMHTCINKYIYMNTYIYIYIYRYIYIYTHTQIHTYLRVNTYICTYIYMYKYTCTPVSHCGTWRIVQHDELWNMPNSKQHTLRHTLHHTLRHTLQHTCNTHCNTAVLQRRTNKAEATLSATHGAIQQQHALQHTCVAARNKTNLK